MITIHISKSNKGILGGVIGALKENRANDPNGHHIVVVPDNAALYVEFKLMNELKLFGTFDIEVASFMRLAKKYLNLSGVLTDEGAMMILKRTAAENENELKCFKSASKSFGFLKEAYEVIKNIRSSRADITKITKSDSVKGKLKYKLDDAAFLYKSYTKAVQDGYGDRLSYLEKLRLQIDKIPHLSSAHVYVMLYDGFSSLELDIIERFFANSVSADVGILGNDSAPNAAAFAEGGVKESLIARAAEYKYRIKIHEPMLSPVFNTVGDNLFSYAKQKKRGAEGRIRLVEAKSPRDEVVFAAREINAAAEGGADYGDIAVLTSDPFRYSEHIRTVFKRFKIPFSAGAKNKLANGAAVKFIKAAGEIFKKNFHAEIFLDFIKNPYSDVSEIDGDEFENYCAARNIEYLTFPLNDENAERVRTAVLDAAAPFKKRGEYISARDFSERVSEFFRANRVAEKTAEYAESGAEDAEDSYFRIQSYKKILSILNETERVFGNGRFRLSEFFDIFLAEAESAEIAPLQQKLNVFTGGTADKVFDKKILFVLGADYDAFPGEKKSSKIISEHEIKVLKDNGIVLDDDGAIAKARAAELLSSPSERLFVCRTEGGRASSVFSQFLGMFGDIEVSRADADIGFFGMKEDAEGKTGSGVSNEGGCLYGIKEDADAEGKTGSGISNEDGHFYGIKDGEDEKNGFEESGRAYTGNLRSFGIPTDTCFYEKQRRENDTAKRRLSDAATETYFNETERGGLNGGESFNGMQYRKAGTEKSRSVIEGNFTETKDGATAYEARLSEAYKKKLDEFVRAVSCRENLSNTVMRGLTSLNAGNKELYAAAFSLLDERSKQRVRNRLSELAAKTPGADADADEKPITDADKLFFRDGIFRVTQAENYYRCPYLHFLKYGIKLKERGDGALEARDAGNITHGVLEKFILRAKNMDKNAAMKEAERITDRIMNGEHYADKLSSPKNIGIKRRLRRDILRICGDLHAFILNSDFKPAFAEAVIADGGDFSPARLKNGLSLNGKIDRIDVLKKNAVVIDYKTGNVSGNVLSDAYYGNNLQLFAYLAALQKNGYAPAAALYLKIKDDFLSEKDSEFRYRATGAVINDIDIIAAIDNDMKNSKGKSGILPVEIKEEGAAGSVLSEEEFQKAVWLGTVMADRAAEEIMSGYIAKKPVKTKGAEACVFCEYKTMCGGEKRTRIQKTADKSAIFRAIDFEIEKRNFEEKQESGSKNDLELKVTPRGAEDSKDRG
ncbi:MAG: PD-(D/E)XK nuclease family protein [Clostridiales bacterium]|jgi:ATP-dependent helicase/DNAse subunit B|nr:PD-(D/E)XK nuclease family protein [Clostridiales bacterium]